MYIEIDGTFEVEPLIRLFIAKEYAFIVHFLNGVDVGIAFSKGLWHVHFNDESRLVFNDSNDVEDITQDLIALLINIIKNTNLDDGDSFREVPARILARLIREKVDAEPGRIEILQPGRNASIDKKGNFIFSPIKEKTA